jgi:hypothetical protein
LDNEASRACPSSHPSCPAHSPAETPTARLPHPQRQPACRPANTEASRARPSALPLPSPQHLLLPASRPPPAAGPPTRRTASAPLSARACPAYELNLPRISPGPLKRPRKHRPPPPSLLPARRLPPASARLSPPQPTVPVNPPQLHRARLICAKRSQEQPPWTRFRDALNNHRHHGPVQPAGRYRPDPPT